MKAVAEFLPKQFEKAIDLARNVATFGQLEFSSHCLRLRITDPMKVLHMDLILTPDVYKCEAEFVFGINLQMFYKLLKSLDNTEEIQIEADDAVMKINQCQHHHTLINQETQAPLAVLDAMCGHQITLGTKMLQRYIRALANASPVVELHYVPASDCLFLESVSSMYRTLFSLDAPSSTDDQEEYRKQYILKFLDTAISPALSDKVELTLGNALMIHDSMPSLDVWIAQAAYTEG
jgi:hypothetical protein